VNQSIYIASFAGYIYTLRELRSVDTAKLWSAHVFAIEEYCILLRKVKVLRVVSSQIEEFLRFFLSENKIKENFNVPEVVNLESTHVQVQVDFEVIPSSEIIVDNSDRQLPSTRLVVAGLAGVCRR